MRLAAAICGLSTFLVSSGCGRDPVPVEHPILVVGLDGLEWSVLLPMSKAGRVPNLARLMEEGVYGELETLTPTYSPVIWTTVATGKRPDEHGIRHFARTLPSGELTLFDSLDRTTKAIWNVSSDYGKRTHVVGWWMTYPVEEIEGVMVAQTNTMEQIDMRGGRQIWKGTLLKGVEGQVSPRHRQNEMISILEDVDERLPALTREIFGEFSFPLSNLEERLWQNCQWAFRADTTYAEIALRLAETDPLPDLTLLYLGGPDVVGHRFWRYKHPEAFEARPSEAQVENFGRIIEDYYVYVDALLGRLLEAYGPETTVFVVSDHGMHASNLDGRFDPDSPPENVNSGDHQDAPPGVLIGAGPLVPVSGSGEPSTIGSVLDITPTLLALMDIPVGEDMTGRALFPPRGQTGRVATHDSDAFFEGRRASPPSRSERERLEQLKRLGYIGDNEKKDP